MKQLMILFLLTSCSFSEVIERPPMEETDSVVMMRKPPRPPDDTTERHPIGFGVTVEDWKDYEKD